MSNKERNRNSELLGSKNSEGFMSKKKETPEELNESRTDRMNELIRNMNNNNTSPAPVKKEISEEELQKDIENIRKKIYREETNENFYTQGGSAAGMRSMNTVNNMQQAVRGASSQSGSVLRPDEAFAIAYKRTIESGEPVNGIGFYDEINWHLQDLGHAKKLPLDIKDFLGKIKKQQ